MPKRGFSVEEENQIRVGLKEHISERFEDWKCFVLEKFKDTREYYDNQHQADRVALDLASRIIEQRLEVLNEWKATVIDFHSIFVTKAEWELRHGQVVEDIRAMRELQAELRGKATQTQVTWAYVFSAVATFIGLVGLVLAFIDRILLE